MEELKEICQSCRCGMCCFFTKYDDKGVENLTINIFDAGYYYKDKYISSLKNVNDILFEEFVKKHNNKLTLNGIQLQIKLNKDYIRINNESFKPSNPCSFLEITLNEKEKTVKSLKCSIYPKEGETDIRPGACIGHEISVLCTANKNRFDHLEINGKEYKLTF